MRAAKYSGRMDLPPPHGYCGLVALQIKERFVSFKDMTKANLSAQESVLLNRLFALYPKDARYMLAVLEDVQAHLGCLPEAMLPHIASHFACPLKALQQWREHSEAFRPHPVRRHRLRVCTGAVCLACGSDALLQALRACRREDVEIEASHCLGACYDPPAARLEEHLFAPADVDQILAVLNGSDGG